MPTEPVPVPTSSTVLAYRSERGELLFTEPITFSPDLSDLWPVDGEWYIY